MKLLWIRIASVLLLGLYGPQLLAVDDSFLVCDADISQRESPFQWQNVEPDVPIYLYPDDAAGLYRLLLNRYLNNLSLNDSTRTEVKAFTRLQEKLVVNETTPLLKAGPNPITDEVELLNKDQLVFIINCADINKAYLIDILHLSVSLKKIHDDSFSELRSQANALVQQRNRQYQNWFDNGLPMWPQETWLNGLFLDESDASEPARHQWVLLRPSIGLGVNTEDGISDGNLEATLGLELGGFVYYLERDYSSYWGLSLLATLGEDAGVGYGALLRYDDYVFGYTRRGKDTGIGIDEDREYFYIGYDLYNLVHEKKDNFKGFKQKVRAEFSELEE